MVTKKKRNRQKLSNDAENNTVVAPADSIKTKLTRDCPYFKTLTL